MLKIKDNVDLKELEKFGFKNRYRHFYKSKPTEREVIEIEVDLETRELKLRSFGDLYHTREDTLYDLMKSDLVEKVEVNLIGKRVMTCDGHVGIVIQHFKPTGRDMTVHIKQDDGRIWYCPDNNIVEIVEEN